MSVAEDLLADHLAAELAEQFARRHAEAGNHPLALQNYVEAVKLYHRCGCTAYEGAAIENAYDHWKMIRDRDGIAPPAGAVGTCRYTIR